MEEEESELGQVVGYVDWEKIRCVQWVGDGMEVDNGIGMDNVGDKERWYALPVVYMLAEVVMVKDLGWVG